MKIKKVNGGGGFRPITLEVTIASKEELSALMDADESLSSFTVKRDMDEEAADIIISMLEGMYAATQD